jgi:hypothetical protein
MIDDDTDPAVASRVYAKVASLPHTPADVISDEEAASRALALAGPEPSEARVEALLAAAHVAEHRFNYAAVLRNVAAARQTAVALGGSIAGRHDFHTTEAVALLYLGRCQEAVESYRTAAALAARVGDVGASVEASADGAWLLLLMGQYKDCITGSSQ